MTVFEMVADHPWDGSGTGSLTATPHRLQKHHLTACLIQNGQWLLDTWIN